MFSLVFVYGSLKRGYALHQLLCDQKFLGEAITQPFYKLYDCGEYPGLVKVAADGVSVKGELYLVAPARLAQLDEVEGIDEGLYLRDEVQLISTPALNSPLASLEKRDSGTSTLRNHSATRSTATDTVQAYFYLLSTSNLKDCGSCWPA